MNNRNICKFVPASVNENLKIICFILETDPDVMKSKKQLPSLRMMLVTKGKGEIILNKSSYTYETGSLVFGFKDEVLTVNSIEATEYMYVDFDGMRADELLRRFDVREYNRNFKGFDGLIPLWQESLSRANEKTIDLAAESILLYTFSRLFGSTPDKNDVVNKMVEITEENFTDTELSISGLAKELGYNPKYLSHLFKEKVGASYTEYLRSLRLKHAVLLLDHGLDSIKNISALSGFSDPLYFSTVFKKSMGLSPKEYIKKINEEE